MRLSPGGGRLQNGGDWKRPYPGLLSCCPLRGAFDNWCLSLTRVPLWQISAFGFAAMGVAHCAEGFENVGNVICASAGKTFGNGCRRYRLLGRRQNNTNGFDAFGHGFWPGEL